MWQMPCNYNRFNKMQRKNSNFVANRAQIQPLIPANKKRIINFEIAGRLARQPVQVPPPSGARSVVRQLCSCPSAQFPLSSPIPASRCLPRFCRLTQTPKRSRAKIRFLRTSAQGAIARRRRNDSAHPVPPPRSRRRLARPPSRADCRRACESPDDGSSSLAPTASSFRAAPSRSTAILPQSSPGAPSPLRGPAGDSPSVFKS